MSDRMAYIFEMAKKHNRVEMQRVFSYNGEYQFAIYLNGARKYTGSESEIRGQIEREEYADFLATKSEAAHAASTAGLCTCGDVPEAEGA